jgi:hypothetical protein
MASRESHLRSVRFDPAGGWQCLSLGCANDVRPLQRSGPRLMIASKQSRHETSSLQVRTLLDKGGTMRKPPGMLSMMKERRLRHL